MAKHDAGGTGKGQVRAMRREPDTIGRLALRVRDAQEYSERIEKDGAEEVAACANAPRAAAKAEECSIAVKSRGRPRFTREGQKSGAPKELSKTMVIAK